jgi:hypothetical protein
VATTTRDLERQLLRATYPDADPGVLIDIDWDTVATAVWLPRLREYHGRHGKTIKRFAARDLAEAVAAAQADDDGPRPGTIGVALAIALTDAGWTLEGKLGEQIELHNEQWSLSPIDVAWAAADQTLDVAAWVQFTEDAGIAKLAVEPGEDATATGVHPDPWSHGLAIPGHQAVSLKLARQPVRSKETLYLALAVLLGLPTGILLIAAALYTPTMAAGVVVAALGVGELAALVALVRIRARAMYGTGTLTVTTDGVRVEHRGILKAPFQLAWADIRAVHVDDTAPSTTRFPVNTSAFPPAIHAGANPTGGFLWVKDQTAPVPYLASSGHDPNVALLVEAPVLAPRVRHATATGPLPGEALVGLLLCVTDAGAARAAFEPWKVMRPADYADAAHINRGYVGDNAHTPASMPTD